MSPFYINDNKLLINNDKLAISSDCCCADRRWLRAQMRIGSIQDSVEQVFLITGNAQIAGTQRNANWLPNVIGTSDNTVYPPQNPTHTFYITYDKTLRNIKYKFSHADTAGRTPPWPSPESIATVPANKLTSEVVNYPIVIYIDAVGKTSTDRAFSTVTAGIKIFNCSLSVVGEPVVAIPDTEVTWFRRPDWVPGNTNTGPAVAFTRTLLPGYKLGKGFTINGSVTMSWEGIRPHGSFIQGWFAFYDFTNDYIL